MFVETKHKTQMEKTTELVKPSEFGITEKQADSMLEGFPQIISERGVLERDYNKILSLDINDPETSIKARAIRLKIRDNRTKGIEPFLKNAKDYFLKGCQFIDAIRRKEVEVSKRMEENLETIEKHFEIQEAKRKEELREKRAAELSKFGEFGNFTGIDIAGLTDEEFEIILNGAAFKFDKAKQEQIRIQEEKEKQERERKVYEEKILAREEMLVPYLNLIQKKGSSFRFLARVEPEEAFIDILNELKVQQADLEKHEEEQRIKREAEIKAKAELEAIDKVRRENEERERVEREKAEAKTQAQLKLSDGKKVKALIEELSAISDKYSFKSKSNSSFFENKVIPAISVLVSEIEKKMK